MANDRTERPRPWLDLYAQGVPHTLQPYPEMSAFEMLERTVQRFPDSPAVAFPVAPMARTLTYRQLLDEVEQMSRALASLGVKRGDRVGLLLPNSPHFVVAHFAIQRLGAVTVGNNPLYTKRELVHQLNDAGVEILIALDLLYPLVEAAQTEVAFRKVIVGKVGDYLGFPINKLAPLKQRREAKHEGRRWPPVPQDAEVTWWADLMKGSYPDVPPAQVDPKEDVAALVYTGGTTGLSKGAMLTHLNIVANAAQTAAWFTGIEEGHEGIVAVLPFFHSYGLGAIMGVGVYKGLKLVLLPRFELDLVLKAVEKERPTLFPGVPRIFIAINESPETAKHDISSIRSCFSGAAPLPVAVAERFEQITGGRLVEGYGLTETSPVTHINPLDGSHRFGTIGLPIPDTDCKLVDIDEPLKEVGGDQEGELCVAGPQIMKAYWNRPEETEDMIRVHPDGIRWLHTGDIAKMDPDGFFRIVDRKKDIIIVSGFNVYPTDVEQVLYRHPKIEKVSVVGVPDETTGEAVKAFVILKAGQEATEDEIKAWARDPEHGLTGYRAPRHVEFRDELPETMVGKVLRRKLQEEEKEKASAQES
ncbi:MAG TPA: long-chain fatty acid--CoA ligase [Actinomycetota bacterium]